MLLLEFWKPNCTYCNQISSSIDAIEKEFKGKLKVKRINTNDFPDLSMLYNIKSVPTLILMQDGRELRRTSGAKSRSAITEFIQMA